MVLEKRVELRGDSSGAGQSAALSVAAGEFLFCIPAVGFERPSRKRGQIYFLEKFGNLFSESDQNRWALRPCTPPYFLEAVKK